MNYTEEYCKDLLQKVIDDLDEWRGYESFYDEDVNMYDNSKIKGIWVARAIIPNEDEMKGGKIIIQIDDNTGKAITYWIYFGLGRPIPLPLEINEEGKYYIPKDLLPE